MTKDKPRYILTEFYCEVHKKWHRMNEEQFYKCLNRYDTYNSFKLAKENND